MTTTGGSWGKTAFPSGNAHGGPSGVYHAVKEAIHLESTTPPIDVGVQGTTAYPFDNEPQSALVFHPHLSKNSDPPVPASPTDSPTLSSSPAHANNGDQVFPSSGLSPNSATTPTVLSQPDFPSPKVGSDSTAGSSPSFPSKSSFNAFRRGSLAAVMAIAPPATRRTSEAPRPPVDFGRAATPRFTMAVSEAALASSRSKGKEVIEMTSVPLRGGMALGKQKTRIEIDAENARMLDRSKEDQAMAKWRKWIVEQPIQGGLPSAEPPSTSGLGPKRGISPLGLSHLNNSLSPTHSADSSLSQLPHLALSHKSSNAGSAELQSSPLQPGSRSNSNNSGYRSPGQANDLEVCVTDTIKALRDVELAVDENMLSRAQRSSADPRRLSTNPRLSDMGNPFIDLSARLSSRRVRPMVIELIQALGHYVDAVWCQRFPDRPCPWVLAGASGSIRPSPPSRQTSDQTATSVSTNTSSEHTWTSRMITAVQEGKASGHVNNPPTREDARFWQSEVTYALKDVDDVVGIYKGSMWAFNKAVKTGRYGDVVDGNVLGSDGEGGNIARLLNDLEESMWGDAPPRPTDLAYELPIDFDPYAVPTDVELAGQGGGLASFFSSNSQATSYPTVPIPDDIYDIPLPDLQLDSTADETLSPPLSSPTTSHAPLSQPLSDPLTLDALKITGKQLTLEEIGRKRHQEWLASRDAAW